MKISNFKNFFEKYIFFHENVPNSLFIIFHTTEYFSYSIACLIIFYIVILSMIDTIKFLKSNKNKNKIMILYNLRNISGQLFSIALNLILAGLVIRLLYTINVKILFLIFIAIGIKEIILLNIDRENDLVRKKLELDLINK